MPRNEQRRSEMWWRGHNDALAGDPPNESYYHYYYDYKLAYDQTRREQRRTQMQRTATRLGTNIWVVVPTLLLLGAFGYWLWTGRASDETDITAQVIPTATVRPTPRPTLTPIPPTPEPILRADGFAVVTGTEGAALRVRSKPGTDFSPVTRFREGQTVRVLEGPESANDLEWWRVEANGESGWAAAPFLAPIAAPAVASEPSAETTAGPTTQ